MKLALIRRQFSAFGGAELYMQRLLAALAEANHELHLFTEAWPQAPQGVTVHPIAASGSRAARARHFAEAALLETARQSYDCIFSLDRTLKQDVCRAGDGVHRVWLERRRQFASSWRKPFIGRGTFHRSMLELEAQTFNPGNTRRVIANSEMVKREILERFGFPADRIHVVRNGVDVARFQRGDRAATRARFGVAEHEFLLLFVGSGWERKGLPFLLSAMTACSNRSHGWIARLQEGIERASVVGEGADHSTRGRVRSPSQRDWCGFDTSARTDQARDQLKLLVIGKGKRPFRCPGNVIFGGPMTDVEDAYAAADLFVFLPIYEPSANVVCEALAAGLPVITSSMNGAAELIEDRVNGTVLANPSDQDRLAQAIGYWWARRCRIAPADSGELGLERNIRETLAVLDLAAQEKAG